MLLFLTIDQAEHRQLQWVGRQSFEIWIVANRVQNALGLLRTCSETPVYESRYAVIVHGLDGVALEWRFRQRVFIVAGSSGSDDKDTFWVVLGQLLYPFDNSVSRPFRHFIQRVQTDQTASFVQGMFKEALGYLDLQLILSEVHRTFGDEYFLACGVITQVQIHRQQGTVGSRFGADRCQVAQHRALARARFANDDEVGGRLSQPFLDTSGAQRPEIKIFRLLCCPHGQVVRAFAAARL